MQPDFSQVAVVADSGRPDDRNLLESRLPPDRGPREQRAEPATATCSKAGCS
jgi:hypothetical protein